MCKLLSINNLKNVKISKKLITEIADILGESNPDGLGIAITRHQNDAIFHKDCDTIDSIDSIESGIYQGPIDTSSNQDIISNIDTLSSINNLQLIMHSRYATNGVSLDATHPFKIADKYYAHNGIVDIPKKHKYPVKTDNDSEFLSHDYDAIGVKALQNYQGYAAILCLDTINKKTTIFRDSKATLYVSFSKSLDTHIITTKKPDCVAIGKLLSKDFTTPLLLKDNTIFTIDICNNITDKSIVKRKKAQAIVKASSEVISKSLGTSYKDKYSYDYDNDYNKDDYAFYKPTCEDFDCNYICESCPHHNCSDRGTWDNTSDSDTPDDNYDYADNDTVIEMINSKK